uniref:Snake toxin/toxin-like domain-containing protein n=1 Tax=Acrobeloides nanus TaxID=290746 RepID=A0A914DX43_9BILA
MLLFFVITITTSSALQCYVCETCGNCNPGTPQECTAGQNNCALVIFNGKAIYRGCSFNNGYSQSSSGEFSFTSCGCQGDLCNGGGHC